LTASFSALLLSLYEVFIIFLFKIQNIGLSFLPVPAHAFKHQQGVYIPGSPVIDV
jgi:hypothetical protein